MDTHSTYRHIFLHAQNYKEIEALAHSLSLSEFCDLLELCVDLQEGVRERLNPLLVGISHHIFSESLNFLKTPQLHILRRVADDEPLQYHVTLVIHALSEKAAASAEAMDQLAREILAYDLKNVAQADLESFKIRIQAGIHFFHTALDKLDLLLSLAWNSNREELISKLTSLKENWLRYLRLELGEPTQGSTPSSGIYALFDEHFGAIYGAAGEDQALSLLIDEDPAFEALAALGIWYVEDYWEIGLLPGIQHAHELRLLPEESDEGARREYRERLSHTARANLEHLGLKTVLDLKQKQLYSRRMLMRYIQANKAQLSPVS